MKRHTPRLLYLLPLAVALCSLLAYEGFDPMPSGPLHLVPMAPR